MQKSLITSVLLAAAMILTGCEDIPSKSESLKAAEKVATEDAPSSAFAMDNLVRVNGWKDGDNYRVKYTYDLVTQHDYEEVVVKTMERFAKDYKALEPAYRLTLEMQLGLNAMLGSLGSGQGGIKGQIAELYALPKVRAFIDNDSELKRPGMNANTVVAMTVLSLQEFQVPKNAAKGNRTPRQLEQAYRKTEKGWEQI